MLKKSIYAKENFNIVKLKVVINEKILNKLLKEIDEYYNYEKKACEFYGSFPPEFNETGKAIEIINVKRIDEGQSDITIPRLYRFEYFEFEPVGLSKLVREILICNNNIELSGLIGKLLNYRTCNEEENDLLQKILLCFSFSETKGILDFKRIILDREYKLDLSNVDPYYIDENTISKRIDDLPFVKTLD